MLREVMAKMMVIYDSVTGNTKKVAEVIAETLKCKSVAVDELAGDGRWDLAVIGTPVHGMRPTARIRGLLDRVSADRFAFFCTYGVPCLGKKMADSCLGFMSSRSSGKVIGVFRCAGFHQFLKTSKGHPDAADLEAAKVFAKACLK